MENIDKNLLIKCSSEEETYKVFDYLDGIGESTDKNYFDFCISWQSVGFNEHLKKWTLKRNIEPKCKNITAEDFFNSMSALGSVVNTIFTVSSTRISSFGLNRSPKNIPTNGQNSALAGSVGIGRRNVPLNPNNTNRFVTELDEGLGEQIDLNQRDGILPNVAIDRIGFTGTRIHKLIYLGIDHDLVADDDNFYNNHVLPRLVILLGREPIFGDEWYDGRVFAKYNGNSWQTS
jgi:hypothetical protein